MALPNQLKGARMTNDTLGVDIDNKVAEIEQAICDIFGFTIDTNVTESPLNCDNAGRITKALLRLKAAGPLGIRFYDSTAASECRLVYESGFLSVSKNTGTEASPVWVGVYSLELATSIVTFGAIPIGPASDPTTANQFVRKAYADGLAALAVALTGDQTIAGVKTFSSFPVTPSSAPTTDYQVANRKLVTDNIVPAASQPEMEAGAVANKYVAPSTAKYSPNSAKAWVRFTGAGSVVVSHNIASVSRTAEGDYTIYWLTDFSSASYVVVATPQHSNNSIVYVVAAYTDRVDIVVKSLAGGSIDPDFVMLAAFGDF
jgi:hypothetical protein